MRVLNSIEQHSTQLSNDKSQKRSSSGVTIKEKTTWTAKPPMRYSSYSLDKLEKLRLVNSYKKFHVDVGVY